MVAFVKILTVDKCVMVDGRNREVEVSLVENRNRVIKCTYYW
jgi:hypothetical protein